MITILTEEYPQEEDVACILSHIFKKRVEKVVYDVPFDDEGMWTWVLNIRGFENVSIEFIKPGGSMCDYIVLENGTPILLIEATQTTESESRNTCFGQRATKLVVARQYYPNIPFIFMYSQRPTFGTDTAHLHSRLYKTNGASVIYRGEPFTDILGDVEPFMTVDELIFRVNSIRKKAGNIPLLIYQTGFDTFDINALLSKGATRQICNDPNIGIVSLLASTIHHMIPSCKIRITSHGVEKMCSSSHKFMMANRQMDLRLSGFDHVTTFGTPLSGSYYKKLMGTVSEKLSTILFHVLAYTNGFDVLFHNHAGGARSKFSARGGYVSIPKEMNIPDLVLKMNEEIYIIEGKSGEHGYKKAEEQLKGLDEFEKVIQDAYPNAVIERCVCISVKNLETVERTPYLAFALDAKGNVM
jgi:hypothetical protein